MSYVDENSGIGTLPHVKIHSSENILREILFHLPWEIILSYIKIFLDLFQDI